MRYQPLDQIFGVRQRTNQTAVVKGMEESTLDGPTASLVFFFGKTLFFKWLDFLYIYNSNLREMSTCDL